MQIRLSELLTSATATGIDLFEINNCEEFSILAVSHIFIASASVKIVDTYRNALYCDNCIYEEPESYNHHHCSARYPVIHQSPGAAKKSRKYARCTGGLWFSNRAI